MHDAPALSNAFTGATAVFILPPAEFDRRIKDELAKWEIVIKTARIKPE